MCAASGSGPAPGSAEGGAGAGPEVVPIARAVAARGARVRVVGAVTVGPELLDAGGRRIVIEDPSGAVEVLLPADGSRVKAGDRLEVSGTITRAYGAPRLRATAVEPRAGGPSVAPLDLLGAPGVAQEWRLVRLRGTVVTVRRLGGRWLAELEVGRERAPITGLRGRGTPSAATGTGGAAAVGAGAAWLVTMYRFPGRDWLQWALLLPSDSLTRASRKTWPEAALRWCLYRTCQYGTHQ